MAEANVQHRPDSVPDWPNEDTSFAVLLYEQGAYEEAIAELFRIADTRDPVAAFCMARCYAALGRWSQAVDCFQRADALCPGEIAIRLGLGEALLADGRKAEAAKPLRQVRAAGPDDAHVDYLLGMALFDSVHESECLDCLAAAFAATGGARIANNYACMLRKVGRQTEAVPVLRAALSVYPGYALGWDTLGALYFELDRPVEARAAFEQAIVIDPVSPRPRIHISNVLDPADERALIMHHLGHALARCGDEIDILYAAMLQYWRLDMAEDAMSVARRALAIDPGNSVVNAKLLHLCLVSCDWQDYDRLVARTLEQIEADIAADRPLGCVLFNLFSLPVKNDLILDAARHQSRQFAERAGAGGIAPFIHPKRRRERLRIGYALPYTHFASMPLVMRDLVTHHDRDRFEVYGYTLKSLSEEKFSREFRDTFDVIADVPESSPQSAARRVHEDGIDILIDVTGHTPISCLPMMALRPAPIQVHAIGYSLTTGADYIDYLVSDAQFMPPAWSDRCHEAVAYLPDCFMPSCPMPTATVPCDRAAFDLPDDAVVFANFNDFYKFDPRMFAVWMRILTRVPESVLWLGGWSPLAERNLKAEAAKHGVAPKRLIFADLVPHDLHAARLALADVALDNQFHGGGVTGTDALWAGLPLVTLCGETPASRLGTTLCMVAGVPELIAGSLQDYEDLAVALALDPVTRGHLRRRLRRGRKTGPLFDQERYRRHLEAAYLTMWQRHGDGLPPETFHVPPLD